MDDERIKEMMDIFSRISNSGSARSEDIADKMFEEFRRDHNTLQQNQIRILRAFITRVSQIEYTDMRNEGSVEWAKKVSKIDTHLPFI
jgi:hypothetical protein